MHSKWLRRQTVVGDNGGWVDRGRSSRMLSWTPKSTYRGAVQ